MLTVVQMPDWQSDQHLHYHLPNDNSDDNTGEYLHSDEPVEMLDIRDHSRSMIGCINERFGDLGSFLAIVRFLRQL